jgi:hypothetical protein
VTLESPIVLAAVSALCSFAGSWAAIRVHLQYLRRDVDRANRSARRAHRRLDLIDAPPAPADAE